MSLRGDSLRAAAAAITSAGLRFALFAALARLAPTSTVGAFALAQWVADMSAMVCSLGLMAIAPRFLPELRDDPLRLHQFLAHWKRWRRALLLLAAIAGTLGSIWMNSKAEWSVHVATAAWATAATALGLQTALLTGFQRFDLILRANIWNGVTALLFVSITALIAPQVHYLSMAMALAVLVSLWLCRLPVQAAPSIAGRNTAETATGWGVDVATLKAFAFNSWLMALLWALAWSRGELPILNHFEGPEQVALFSAATVLAGGAIQFILLGTAAVGPHLTRLWFTDRHAEAIRTAQTAMSVQLLISGLLSLFLMLLGSHLLNWIFGGRYEPAYSTLAILALTLPAFSTAAQSHLLQILSNGVINRNLLLLVVAVLMISAWFLVPQLGRDGAAWARLLAIGLYAVALVGLCVSKFGWSVVPARNVSGVLMVVLASHWVETLDVAMAFRAGVSATLAGAMLVFMRTAEGTSLVQHLIGQRLARQPKGST